MASTSEENKPGDVQDDNVATIKEVDIEAQEVEEKEEKKDKKKFTLKRKCMVFIYLIAIISQIYAIVVQILDWSKDHLIDFGHIIIWVAFSVGFLLIVLSSILEITLLRMDSFREVLELLRGEVDRLKIQNDTLTVNVNKAEVEVDSLKKQEQKLDAIAKNQGTNVTDLVSLTKQNAATLEGMNRVLAQKAVHNLTAIVLRSDMDGDNKITDFELDTMILRLQMARGVSFDEEKLKEEVIKRGGDIYAVFDIVKKMHEPDSVFHVSKDEIKAHIEEEML